MLDNEGWFWCVDQYFDVKVKVLMSMIASEGPLLSIDFGFEMGQSSIEFWNGSNDFEGSMLISKGYRHGHALYQVSKCSQEELKFVDLNP